MKSIIKDMALLMLLLWLGAPIMCAISVWLDLHAGWAAGWSFFLVGAVGVIFAGWRLIVKEHE